jgi:hypothetical protein
VLFLFSPADQASNLLSEAARFSTHHHHPRETAQREILDASCFFCFHPPIKLRIYSPKLHVSPAIIIILTKLRNEKFSTLRAFFFSPADQASNLLSEAARCSCHHHRPHKAAQREILDALCFFFSHADQASNLLSEAARFSSHHHHPRNEKFSTLRTFSQPILGMIIIRPNMRPRIHHDVAPNAVTILPLHRPR